MELDFEVGRKWKAIFFIARTKSKKITVIRRRQNGIRAADTK